MHSRQTLFYWLATLFLLMILLLACNSLEQATTTPIRTETVPTTTIPDLPSPTSLPSTPEIFPYQDATQSTAVRVEDLLS